MLLFERGIRNVSTSIEDHTVYHLFRHFAFNDFSKKVFTCMKGNWTVWTSCNLSQRLCAGIRRAKAGKAGPPGTINHDPCAAKVPILSYVVLTAHRYLNITFSLAGSFPIFSLLDRPLQLSVRGRRRNPTCLHPLNVRSAASQLYFPHSDARSHPRTQRPDTSERRGACKEPRRVIASFWRGRRDRSYKVTDAWALPSGG